MNKTQRIQLKEGFQGLLKDIGAADLDFTNTTKQAVGESNQRVASKLSQQAGVKENQVPVIVSRSKDGYPFYQAGDEATTEYLNATRNIDEASLKWADESLLGRGNKPFETMIDVPDGRPLGLLPSDVGIMTKGVESPTLSFLAGTTEDSLFNDASLKRLWGVGFDGGIKSGTKNLLANALGYGQAGKLQQRLRDKAAKSAETGGSKVGQYWNSGWANAIGAVANPVSATAGTATLGAMLAGGRQEAETAADAKGRLLNAEEAMLAGQFGQDTDWTNPASYERFMSGEGLYDKQTMQEAWGDVRDAYDNDKKFSRVMQADAGEVLDKVITAYGRRLESRGGNVFRRDSAGNPIKKAKKAGSQPEFETYSPLSAADLKKKIESEGLSIVGFNQQIGDDGKTQVGFKAKDGSRYVAVLQYAKGEDYKNLAAQSEESKKAEKTAKNEPEKTPKNRAEAAAIAAERIKSLPKRAKWTFVKVDPTAKGPTAIYRDKEGNPISPEF